VYVSRLSIVDFRSYVEVLLELEAGITTFVGRNGQGKTNLVEAIGYASSLGSHRVATDAPLIRNGAERALVRVEVQRADRAQLLEIEIVAGRANRARINRSPIPRVRELVGILQTVLFAPEDLALVKGDPSDRRRYIDELLTARNPRMAGVRADYDRVLKQRNALLKSAAAARSSSSIEPTLVVWDEQLAQRGAELMHARSALLADLAQPVAGAYSQLAPGGGDIALALASSVEGASLAATSPVPEVDELRALIESTIVAKRREELARGVTVVGPHRDDVVISLGANPAKGYASHGESWSCALSLRLGAYEVLRSLDDGGDPVLILDDVFAELDAGRRQRLAQMVAGAEQVLITAAVAQDVPAELEGAQILVDGGTVTPQ
jgi:DNA replication and repair protein RecF